MPQAYPAVIRYFELPMASQSLITPAMQSAVGHLLHSNATKIELGAISCFADAIGDPNTRFLAHAPPTFLRMLQPAIPLLPDADTVPKVLDGGSSWEYLLPVRPGDLITCTTQLETLTEREGRLGKMLFAVYVTEYNNQVGKLVARQHNTLIRYP